MLAAAGAADLILPPVLAELVAVATAAYSRAQLVHLELLVPAEAEAVRVLLLV
jgi:hypothetical protein